MINIDDQKSREAVRKFMKVSGLKYKPWCLKANISDGALRAYLREKNPTNMTLKNLEKLATAAGVSLPEMLGQNPQYMVINDRETGLIATFQAIFAVLITRDILKTSELENILNQQVLNFQKKNQPGAIEVTEMLIDSLGLRSHEEKIQKFRMLLSPSPAG